MLKSSLKNQSTKEIAGYAVTENRTLFPERESSAPVPDYQAATLLCKLNCNTHELTIDKINTAVINWKENRVSAK